MKYFCFDSLDNNFSLFDTLEEARLFAESILSMYRDDAGDSGWDDSIEDSIGYGEVKGLCKKGKVYNKKDYTASEWEDMGFYDSFETCCEYSLMETDQKEPKS